MRNLKRALSLALASVMLLGMMVVGTSAASYPDVKDSDNVEAIEVLNAVGVMIGDRGNFRPDAAVNRHEMAAIMARLILGEDAETYVGTHPFTDVYPWADKYVAACYENGIINGTSKTTFSGNQPLTAIQAATMMLRALGYEHLTKGASDWRVPVAAQANKIGLFRGVTSSPSAQLTRNQVAQLALNTLESDMVEFTGELGWEVNGISIGTQLKWDGIKDLNNVSNGGYNYTNDPTGAGAPTTHQKEYLQLLEDLYDGKLKKITDADDYGMPATTWEYDGKDVVTTAKAAEYTWTTGVEDITLDDLYKVLGDKTGPLVVFENGTPTDGTLTGNTLAGTTCVTPTKGATASADKKLAAYKGATIYAVDKFTNVAAPGTSVDISTAPDGKVDSLIVVYPYLAKVTKVTDATAKADRKITMDVWSSDDGAKISGVTYETNDFAKDDFVLVYPDGNMTTTEARTSTQMSNNIIDVKLADTVKGKVTTVKDASGPVRKSLTIDGTVYTVGGDSLATKGLADNTLVKNSTFGFTSEYTLYLSNGYILGAEGTSGAKDIDNIVYVTDNSFNPVDDYGTNTGDHRVQVIRMDGTVEILKAEARLTGVPTGGAFYKIDDTDDNDGKYTFTAADASSAIDNSAVYYGTNAINVSGGYTMKADDKNVTIDSVGGKTTAYLTANSRILFVKDSKADLKTSMVMGPVRQNVADDSVVLLSMDSGNYIVEVLVVKAEKTDASDDVVYVNNSPKGTQADGVNLYKIYDVKTGESREVPAKPGDVVSGFATYSVNDKGEYKFTATTVASSKNADGSYTISQAITKYGNLLSEGALLVDGDAAGAVIINETGDSDYDNLNLSDITGAKDLAGKLYMVDEKVIAIVVTSYSENGVRAVATASAATTARDISSTGPTTTVAGVAVTLTGKTEDNKMAAVKDALDGDTLASNWTFTIESNGSIKAVAQTAGAEGTTGPAALTDGFTQTKPGKEAVSAEKATATVTLAAGESISAGGVTIAFNTLSTNGDKADQAAGSDMTYSWNDTTKAVTLTAKTAGVAGNNLEYTGKDGNTAKLSGGKDAASAVAAEYTLAKSAVLLSAVETLNFNSKTYTVTGADLDAKMQSWATQYNAEGHDTNWTASVDTTADKFVFTAKSVGASPVAPTGTTITTPGVAG